MEKISGIKAVIFDLGDTLIPFWERQFERIWDCVHRFLQAKLPELTRPQMMEAYERALDDQRRVNAPVLRESDFEERMRNFLRYLDETIAHDGFAEQTLKCYHDAFIQEVERPEYLLKFLGKVHSRYKTGLISNFPFGPAIRSAIDKLEIEPYLDSIVISGEFGRVKPHSEIFLHCLKELGVQPPEAIYIGDNWDGDIVGARSVGMHAAYTVQWSGKTAPQTEGVFVLNHLTELEKVIRI